MAYMALYRKHRSKTFDEILGQDHITTTIKNQIMNDKIAHAYLFCGIRGTGKTSIAKILAKAVNCESPVNGNPCLKCPTCEAIANETVLNVIEIDAASNTGVDDVRNIRDDALYMPQTGKYKVYIIDEVHMLSKNAFNALLKILEEPPKHVIFILATTESQKIPQTILSRCQRFDLKRISKTLMHDRMKEYIEEEGAILEDRAIDYIVELSEGSMRDGLSILEQIISIKQGQEITLEDVLNVLGNVDYDTYNKFTMDLENRDIKGCIEKVNEIYDDGKDIVNFASMYCNYLRNLVLVASNTNISLLDMSEENASTIKDVAGKISANRLIYLLEEFINCEKAMRYSNMPKLTLEMLIIRLCKEEEIYSPVQMMQAGTMAQAAGSEMPVKKAKPRIANKVETIAEGDIDAYIGAWNAVVDATEDMIVRNKLNQVSINQLEGNKVYMTADLKYVVDYVVKVKDRLQKVLPKLNDKEIEIYIDETSKIREAMDNQSKAMDSEDVDDITKALAKANIEVNIE